MNVIVNNQVKVVIPPLCQVYKTDKIVLHKTFFYREGDRIPYKNKPSMLKNWSEDGRTSISPDESNRQPADTENISALDQLSTAKVQQNSETAKL